MDCKDENLAVRNGVRHQGIYEWNGDGHILGIVSSRHHSHQAGSKARRNWRCGNCGARDHITIDCSGLHYAYSRSQV
ncbi:hypothetical protein H257_17887 [Aphanomyces astaci]|uniref:Uncharacterized protein n=1 Tax=Aphanomyces astaci TaxID=112090 RepID=W4FEN4_APHAT|nr:hypothetical protein H257_17887 [Aphanomyces astaci]ETV65349.1 hypothetical protein H257_17887 [Aphanomyces astaci]|eukprot:XP_009845144.1 hypothetical protein H257_17887 [Aphanomyces astaci]